MIRLTGMWEHKQDPNRPATFTGNIGNGKLVMIYNEHKHSDNEPDYILYIKEKESNERL